MKIGSSLLYGIGCFFAVGGAIGSEVQMIVRHELNDGSGRYAAFPNLYFVRDGKTLQLSVTARERRSHHDSRGEQIILTSTDCGLSWQREKVGAPPMVFSDDAPNKYSYVAAVGWRTVKANEAPPAGAYVWQEAGERFVAVGIVERTSTNDGLSWQTKQLSAPPSSMVMNYNAASHLKTKSGTRLTALYFKERPTSRSSVLIARRPPGATEWQLIAIPQSDEPSDLGFDETALVEIPDGRILALMRPDPDKIGRIYISQSADNGLIWTRPIKSEVVGYPASAVFYKGSVLITVADRLSRPFLLKAYVLNSKTLDIERLYVLDKILDGSQSDFGYPITVACEDYLTTTYYVPGADGAAYPITVLWKH